MIGVIFATAREAAPFLHRTEAKSVPGTPYVEHTFSFNEDQVRGVVIISGIGPVKAEIGAQYLIEKRGVKKNTECRYLRRAREKYRSPHNLHHQISRLHSGIIR